MEFNAINKEISDKKKSSKGKDKCEELCEKSKNHKPKITAQEEESENILKKRDDKLNLIGNILGDACPVFEKEDDNVPIKTWGTKPDMEIDGKTIGKLHHHNIMDLLDMVELERGAKVAGHRGFFLKGVGVLFN